jgi:O-antigen/teichoic acid export membrane protein
MKRLLGLLTSHNARISAIHYFGSFTVNVGNYFFHLVLLRILSPDAYGEFLSYLSFLYLISIPSQTINILVSKYVASFFGKNDKVAINNFFYFLLNKTFLPTLILAIFIILSSSKLSILFKADPQAFVILSISLILSLFLSIIRSYILAFQKYIFNVALSLFEIAIKISLAFILIEMGFSATGAVLAILLTGIIILIASFLKIKKYIYPKLKTIKKLNINIKKMAFYSLIFSAGSVSLLSLDVLLVRLFFTPVESGIYSAVSVLARMIFYGLIPFASLMLPFVSHRFAAGLPTKTVLYKILAAVIAFGVFGSSLFASFPAKVIALLSGANYLAGTTILPLFSISLFFLGLSYILLSYLIAINKNKSALVLTAFFIIQPILITLMHQSLYQVVVINLSVQVSLFVSLLIYYYTQTKDVT